MMIKLAFSFCILLVVSYKAETYRLMRFSGGGIYFWWQAGAATYLQEKRDLSDVAVMGASAGSISATLTALDISFEEAAELAIRIGKENNVWDLKTGLAFVWGPMIREFLEEIIPNDINQETLARINILATPRAVLKGPQLLSNFYHKSDLIDAVMASIHIPLFMNGKPWTSFRGKKYIDGSMWSWIADVKGPFPYEPVDLERDIFYIDYTHDKDFVQSLEDSSIVKLINPDGLYNMMDAGYNYMRCRDMQGKLPEQFLPSSALYPPSTRTSSDVRTTGCSNALIEELFIGKVNSRNNNAKSDNFGPPPLII
mmetsp:Transcript_9958/g.16675  ORF Transcript_9958/g.16675 Transcript_9958/m.16675 type:complete len:312 (-) Transcript_9958:1182-2117(-)